MSLYKVKHLPLLFYEFLCYFFLCSLYNNFYFYLIEIWLVCANCILSRLKLQCCNFIINVIPSRNNERVG